MRYVVLAAWVVAAGCLAGGRLWAADKPSVDLSDLTPKRQTGRVVSNASAMGGQLNPGRERFQRGLGMHADSEVVYDVSGQDGRFEAWVGPNRWALDCTVAIRVYTDGQLAFDSGDVTQQPWRPGGCNPWQPARVCVPLAGAKELRLVTQLCRGEKRNAMVDWGDARLVNAAAPRFVRRQPVERYALSPAPPMGWNSWNRTGPNIDEKLVLETADAMVSSGMRDLGYVYVSLDDGWQGDPACDAAGAPLWHKQRFPHGMKPLAESMHQRGLKFGLYSRPAWTRGNEALLANALADWKIDYLKYDFSAPDEIRRMAAAIRQAGRPVVFNSCEWGNEEPWHWSWLVGCQSFRFTYDQCDHWSSPADWNAGIGVTVGFDQAEFVGHLIRPGCWMDADALLAGLRGKNCHPPDAKGCTDVEYRTQFSFLCLMSSSLIASCDLRTMDAATKSTFTNREAIAINQDSLGVPAWKARKLAELEVWQKPLAGGDWAVGLLNRGNKPATVTARWIDLGLDGAYHIRDLWSGKESQESGQELQRPVAAHELVLLRLHSLK
jgi:alpha-galactosidase